MVGRMVPQKDFVTLIKAFELMSNRHGRSELHIAGAGPDEQVIRLAASSITDKVEFHGELAYEDALALIAGSDLYVQSTRGEADLSTSVLHAMMSGVPVICSRAPGILDELASSPGLELVSLFEMGDAKGLADEIERLASDDGLRELLVSSSREFIERVHGPEANRELWMNLLKSINMGVVK